MKLKNHKRMLVSFERFKYRSPNGWIEGVGVVPQSSGKLPVVIFCRGGNRDFAAINQRVINGFMLPLALAGFAVFGSQYSGGPNSQGKDEFGGKDAADVPALFQTLKHGSWKLNFTKVGVLGTSRGALMGLMAIRDGLPAKRAAFVGGMFDSRKTRKERPDVYSMWKKANMFDPDDQDEIERRSPIAFADQLPNIPYLLLHSKKDSRVPVRQAKQMAKKLPKAKLMLFSGDDHALVDMWEERNRQIIEWFGKL